MDSPNADSEVPFYRSGAIIGAAMLLCNGRSRSWLPADR
jgi:hypothetical protein